MVRLGRNYRDAEKYVAKRTVHELSFDKNKKTEGDIP